MKRNIDAVEVRGKRVLMRADFNVPLDGKRITDDRRIRSALPTIRRVVEGGGRLILMSHLGRPKGQPDDAVKYSLAPVAGRLGELLGRPVKMLGNCVGGDVAACVDSLEDGEVALLENLRFHDAETVKDKKAKDDPKLREAKDTFAGKLAALADVYVNDAFGTCHRDNASMLTVPQLMDGKPRVVGYLVEKELKFLGEAVANPARPFVCLLGGAKVSDKLGVIRSLMTRCDTIVIGGAMAYTFLKADGVPVGRSLVEPELIETAAALRKEAGDRLRLPVDSVAASEIAAGVTVHACDGSIPDDLMGLDIGPKTIDAFRLVLSSARTVVWNGPMGVFETPPFDVGTLAMAEAVAQATENGAISVVGGGDSAAAVDKCGLADRMTHISTGGGASLEFLEGKPFAAIDVLDDA